jgi:hypothetical protein
MLKPRSREEEEFFEVLDRLEASIEENQRMEELILILSKPDQKAEAEKLRARERGLEARVRQLETTAREATRQAAWNAEILGKLKTRLGATSNADLIRKAESLTLEGGAR